MDEIPYTWRHERYCNTLAAKGVVVEDVPYMGFGSVRLLNKGGQPVEPALPAFGCRAAGSLGKVVSLHKNDSDEAIEWHITGYGDD